MGSVNFWDGIGLPDIGSHVGYKCASSGDRINIAVVSGYDIKPHLDGDPAYHRVFINFERGNCRLLKDVMSVYCIRDEAGQK